MDKIFDLVKYINFEVTFTIIASLSSLLTVLFKLSVFTSDKYRKRTKGKAAILVNKSERGDMVSGDKVIIHTSNASNVIIQNSVEVAKTKGKPKVLKAFVIIALVYLLLTVFLNWENIVITKNTILLYVGLFLMMCGGMFVSVIRKNYKDDKELFDVKDSDLIYPLLFSVFVFYPLLIMVDTDQNSKLLFYTAFLNGYFWKTIVTEAEEDRKPKKE